MTDSPSLLFETSPISDEDSKKKRPVKRKKHDEACVPQGSDWCDDANYTPGFMLSLDSVPCDQCGAPSDLVSVIRDRNGKESWIVMCGWWCHHSWRIDPIEGLLDKADTESKQFVMRGGLHAGRTFDEIAARPDGLFYIKSLAVLADRQAVTLAAREWLSRNNR